MNIQANSISKVINEINLKEKIRNIIFVGGYCSNEIILKLIKENLNIITTYLQPSNPSLAIMEGAVIFGIEPSIISIRKAKYTFGERLNKPWDEKNILEKERNILIKILKNGFVGIVLINI